MAFCHECGSEVAENDVFCPYCGITLKPVSNDDVQADEAFESTIMMPASDAAKSSQASEAEDKEILPAADVKAESANDAEPLPQDSENAFDKPAPDSDLIPTPVFLQQFNESENKLSSISGEDSSEKTPQNTTVDGDKPDVVTPDIDEQFEVDQSTVPVDLASKSEEIVDISPSGSIQPADSESLENIPESSPVDADIEAEPSVAAPIAMPDEKLAEFDQNASSPMFDSVRIIDNRASDSTPPIEIHPSTVARPQTAPNIGLVDTDGRKSAKLKPLEEGTVLNNRYEIVRKIGGGGMGAVYLASDNNLGGVLRAVKEMVQSYIEEAQQEKSIEDFKRESMILSSLDHQSIPTIFDYFFDEKESRFYLVMKYISGGDLAARLRAAPEGRIDEKTVTEWAIQISDVLDYLHSQPSTIVYRDLKPSNIMIDGNSAKVVLIDFGIARSIGQVQEKGVTAVGTMGYAPPELFSGNVEPRSDIYSLGSTMFHLLTGADPQSNPLLIFDFQKNPRPRQINSQLSDQMESFLMRAVEYNAESRFGSAAEARQILTAHLENLKRGAVTYGIKEIPQSVSLENQSVFCGFCGQKIVATDLFCAFCGAKQPIAQQGVHSEIYAHSPPTAKLMMVGTSDLNAPVFSIDKDETLIGRRDPMSNIFPEIDLSRYDPQTKISRRHARIWREGSNFMLEDLGSSNGTLLFQDVSDTVRLAPRIPHALTSGDKIKVGDTMLHFVLG